MALVRSLYICINMYDFKVWILRNFNKLWLFIAYWSNMVSEPKVQTRIKDQSCFNYHSRNGLVLKEIIYKRRQSKKDERSERSSIEGMRAVSIVSQRTTIRRTIVQNQPDQDRRGNGRSNRQLKLQHKIRNIFHVWLWLEDWLKISKQFHFSLC